MLTGTDLLSKVQELQQQNANRTDIVIGCGYVKESGHAAYVDFYTALLKAKYPNGLPEVENVETDIEFKDEEEHEKFEDLCENYPQQAVEIYYNNIGNLDEFEDAYRGQYSSEADFAEEICAQFSDHQLPSWIVIDYQATWDTALRYDYWEEDGYFFENM